MARVVGMDLQVHGLETPTGLQLWHKVRAMGWQTPADGCQRWNAASDHK